MPIAWDAYKSRLMVAMDNMLLSKSGNAAKAHKEIAKEIVDGYVEALSGGGDTILKAKVIISPANIASAKITIAAGLAIGNPASVKLSIDTAVMALWAGATLDAGACAPLPGHVFHAPVSTVLPTGIMMFIPPVFTPKVSEPPSHESFIDNLISGMKIHAMATSGIHPSMILPPPAPTYPLPWVGYV